MATQEPEYLSGAEVARRLGISRQAVKQASVRGTLKTTMVNGAPVFTETDMRAWLATRAEWKASRPRWAGSTLDVTADAK